MKLQTFPNGFNLWLSANDTYNWANRPGSSWPCSQLSGNRLWVQFDSNGLCDITINGQSGDCDATELNACLSDYLSDRLPKDHPCYFVAVGAIRECLTLSLMNAKHTKGPWMVERLESHR